MSELNLVEDEDCAELLFPEEFKEATPLSVTEVKIILESQLDGRDNSDECEIRVAECTQKAFVHVSRFSRFRNAGVIAHVRNFLKKFKLHQFETTQLLTLLPKTVEEAISLIPSLDGRDIGDIQEIVDKLEDARKM